MTHDHGPGRSPGSPRAGRRWAGALRGVARAAQCNGRESIDCRLRPWLSPLVPGIINCPRKKKIQQSLSESNAFVCGGSLARGGARPGGSGGPGRRRGGGERTRSHTIATSLARQLRMRPYAAAMALRADIVTGARRLGEDGGRTALAVRRVGRPRRLPARAMHGQWAEAALGGPETRRSPRPSRHG